MKELLIMAKSLGGGGSEVALIELINALPEELYNIRLNQLSRTKEAYGRYRNVFLEDYSELEMEIAELDVKQAGYEHRNKSSGVPQFYRFSHPTSNRYPAMIELFTRKLDAIQLPGDAVLTPLPMDEDISSLSAILLDDDYYEFLKQGKVTVDGVTVLDAAYLIPFKAKAWMDLTDRKAAGEHVDSKNITPIKLPPTRRSASGQSKRPGGSSGPRTLRRSSTIG